MKINKKHSNFLKTMDLILRKENISRISLAAETGLTRAAIGQLVDELLKKNLIREAGIGETRGGRPPTLLQPAPEGCYFIGAAIFDFSWSIILMDLSGSIIDQSIIAISEMTAERAVETLGIGISEIKEKHKTKNILPRIGIGAPGLVDSSKGTIVSAVDIHWKEIPLGQMIKEKTDLSSIIVNRSKVSALASYYLHNPENYRNIVSIVIGTGVASGLILDHKLYMGSSFGAGELGHTTIIPNGPACPCGNRGCLQALIGENAILDRGKDMALRNGYPLPENIEDILKLSAEGEIYFHIIEEVAEYLSIAIGNMINILNPELIVLSGPVISGCPGLLDMVIKQIEYRSMKHNQKAVSIITSDWGVQTAAIGSAYLLRENIKEILDNC